MISLKTIVKIFILLVVVTLGITLHIAEADSSMLTQGQVLKYQNENAYDTKMNAWLGKLSKAESGNDSNMVFLDVNGKYSYSCLQFQKETWDHYAKKFGIKSDIMNCQAQKEVAKDMIASDYNLWKSWYNSVVYKIGKPPIYS